MAHLTTSIETSSFAQRHRKGLRRGLFIGVPVIVLLVIGVCVANQHWPYRYRNVRPMLEQLLASKITVSSYHRTYFPHPGFVAKALTLRRTTAPNLPPIGSTEDLTVQASWLDLLLLRPRIRLVDIKGLHVVIPPVGSKENQEDFPPGSTAEFAGPEVAIETLVIHGAALDIMRTSGGKYTYPIRQLIMHNVQQGKAATYFVDMQNASPAGHIQASGKFGPLNANNLGLTPLSGRFTFTAVQLNQIGELHGTLASQGHFSGVLDAIEAYATASTPDFAVSKGRPAPLEGSVQCTLNGLNSNIVLHRIELKRGQTTVKAAGTITGPADQAKTTDVDLTVVNGRAQDLLYPFLHDSPPVEGAVSLKAHAHLAPQNDDDAFLHRLTVDGHFSLPKEQLTNRKTEQTLSDFSRRAQGSKSDEKDSQEDRKNSEPDSHADVLSALVGQVTIRNGIVATRRLTFKIPGASANLNGHYDLVSGKVNLVGNLKMESDISHAATGLKSFLLKPLAPFFKKRRAGAVVPVAVTGTPGHYQVTQNLFHDK